MDFLDAGRRWLRDRTTPAVAWTTLQAMAVAFRTGPSLRRHLAHRHPVTGTPFTFRARFQFSTRDGATNLHAVFADGRMHVGIGPLDRPDVVARLRDLDVMRAFFAPGADLFGFLLRNEVSFEGNLSYLAKFGHMSTALQLRGRQRHPPPRAALSEPRGRQAPGESKGRPLDRSTAPPTGAPCRERPDGEVRFLDDPYLARWTLDDFPRAARLLRAHRTVPPEICTERPRLLTEFLLRERERGAAEPPVLRQGRALRHVLFRKQAIVHDDDLFLGTTTSKRIGVVIYPECGGTAMWPELLTMAARDLNPYRISDEDIAVLDHEVFPFWMDENVREWARRKEGDPLALRLEERFVLYFLWKNHAVSHTIADMPLVLSRGLLDLRDEEQRREAEATDDGARAFHQAAQAAIDGVLDYADRLADRALLAADALDPAAGARAAELREMARIVRKVPARPAESLREALQSVWLVFLCLHQESTNAGLSVGRLDAWLEPFFRRDLEPVADPAGRERRIHAALELVCAFLLKFTDHLPMVPDIGNRLFGGSSSDQVITLGGVTSDGRSAVGDMTWLFLKATELLRLRDPNMNARCAPGVNSHAYLRRLCEVNLLTRATPSIHNDEVVVGSLVGQGFSREHARDWGATGCVEPTSCGRHFGHTNCMMFNLVAPLEMALRDGVHPLIGPERLGPATGDPRGFGAFDAFVAAYERQLAWLIDLSVEGNDLLGRAHQALRPTPLLSALFDGPRETGRDLIDGGARYNTSGTAMIGLTDVIDSLASIRTLVFERRAVDFAALLRALDDDFVGHDTLLSEIRTRVPRFGQDDPLPGELAARIQRFVFNCFQQKRNYRGGRYVPGYWSMSNHVAFGTLSGALPSGRRRGQAFTPGLTPAPLCGAPLTEQMRAVAGLDAAVMPNNIAFNVKLAPGAHDSHAQLLQRLTAYAEAYFAMGGMQIQFNVVSSATLRDAMAHPDRYPDLLVRISGYNAYFVELNADMQRELIERMEHSLGS
ncbi:MAG: formate acetyltransferase [Deltaproteobacteria bacterium]|nr:formate acetyltransferase [Deltaproteobacteria bacterium]